MYTIAMIWGSRAMLLVIMPLFVIGVAVYIHSEEKELRKRFDKDYHAYEEQTGYVLPRFHVLLKPIFFLLSRFYFPITVKNRQYIPKRAPFFLVANHRNYLDPFMISCTLPYKVHYVTTFEMFRSPITALIFRLFGCIPKRRYCHDLESVKAIIATINKGGVIGIFPEGERSYTGVPLKLKSEPLKLFARFPGIPIVPVSVSGNYIMWPRWGKGWRKCPVTIEYRPAIHSDRAHDLTGLRDQIASAITPDDRARKTRHKNRAHDIQAILYRCPSCRRFDSLKPAGCDLACSACGAHFFVTEDYCVAGKESNTLTSIEEYYESVRIGPEDIKTEKQPIAVSDDCRFFIEKDNNFALSLKGQLILLKDRVAIKGNQAEIIIEIKNILGATIEGVKNLQIYDLERKQAFQLVFPYESARKWQDYIAVVHNQQLNKTLTTR